MKRNIPQYGLLGERLSHSISPAIHRLLGDYPYRLYEVSPAELGNFLGSCDLAGMNVTIPYKKAVIPFCTALSERAEKIGAVNTLLRRADGWYGDNTDYDGFLFLLRHAGLAEKIRGEKTLLLGSGGASAAVKAVLEDLGGHFCIISRSGENNYENIERHTDAAFLVNATPVGMYPAVDASPLDLRRLPWLRAVVDLIYNPAQTALMAGAASLGIPAHGGLPMLVAQAKAAAERFTGVPIPDERIAEILAHDAFTGRISEH